MPPTTTKPVKAENLNPLFTRNSSWNYVNFNKSLQREENYSISLLRTHSVTVFRNVTQTCSKWESSPPMCFSCLFLEGKLRLKSQLTPQTILQFTLPLVEYIFCDPNVLFHTIKWPQIVIKCDPGKMFPNCKCSARWTKCQQNVSRKRNNDIHSEMCNNNNKSNKNFF